METGLRVIPGVTLPSALSGVSSYKVQESERWRYPLLQSLLQIKEEQWEIRFDEEDEIHFDEDDISDMIYEVCTS